MVFGLTLAAAASPAAAAAPGDIGNRFDWPLRPRPAVTRSFDKPQERWNRGHRGVDLMSSVDQRVYAAGPGTVVFAGSLAGRPLVSVEHEGGLRTTYEPVTPLVRPGQRVAEGSAIGTLLPGHQGCAAAACLHWGALRGPASAADYLDPLGLLRSTPIRLKPLTRS
ncbi:M23 family metallopeptidase [Mycobacteroides sp. LB1]|uniref:M23 family metallopeptidase n=1 Tax=Mycobacteroides sp. LB1 TaxID=2750814 RepID=UPI00352E5719